jgi:hypothetical protein
MSIFSIALSARNVSITDASDSRVAIWFAALLHAEAGQCDASHATLLAWVMALPSGLDPAEAAAAVLDYQRDQAKANLSEQLTILLRDVTAYPAPRLNRLRSGRRRVPVAGVN